MYVHSACPESRGKDTNIVVQLSLPPTAHPEASKPTEIPIRNIQTTPGLLKNNMKPRNLSLSVQRTGAKRTGILSFLDHGLLLWALRLELYNGIHTFLANRS
jgi:hypothetical protein